MRRETVHKSFFQHDPTRKNVDWPDWGEGETLACT